MTSPSTQRSEPVLHCNQSASVLGAIEASWRGRRANAHETPDLYVHLVETLKDSGFVVDRTDGLEILEHCRKAGLPIVDILHHLEARVRKAGYNGGPLSLADYTSGSQAIYVFYDSGRFPVFAEIRTRATVRMTDALGAK